MFALVLLAAPSLGAMHFPISCNKTAQADVTRGMLAVHSFWYDEAKASFERAERHDPNCALAYAGEALSVDYLLWGYHDQETGAKALAKIPAAAKMTPKERALVDAVRALFADGKARPVQVHDFEAALARAHATYPDDDEFAAFDALAQLVVADLDHPDDRSIGARTRAAALAFEVFARNPNHPGAAHYIIHSLDLPELAPLALPAARKYAAIAPEAFHARHMPAHIYTRLGMWRDALASCESAWEASDKWQKKQSLDPGQRDYHSMHWIIDLHLQLGQRKAADEALAQWSETVGATKQDGMKAHYLGRVADYLRATDDWSRVDALLAPLEKNARSGEAAAGPGCSQHAAHAGMPWDSAIPMGVLAIRATAAARRGDAKTARELFARSRKVGEAARKHEEQMMGKKATDLAYQMDEIGLEANIAVGKKDDKAAIAQFGKLVELESRGGAGEGSPTYVSSDALGEALLRARQPKAAAEVFAQTLVEYPGHTRALLGLARARKALGDEAGARETYGQLAAIWKDADADFPGVAEARAAR